MSDIKINNSEENGTELNDEKKSLSLFQRILYVFTNPIRVMEDISNRPKVLVPLLIIMAVLVLLLLARLDLFKEFTMEQIRLRMGENAQNIEITDNVLNISVYSGLAGVSVAPVLTLFFKSLVAYGIAQVFNGKGKFKATFSVVTFSYFIQIFGEAIRAIIGLLTGTYLVTTSFAVFLPGTDIQTPLYILMSHLDVFVIWYLIVSLIGISVVHKISKGKAAVAVFGPWAIMVGISVVSVMIRG